MTECVDPDTLLEWLQTGVGDDRDIQLMALEQLCMLLLMSDNIDRCFESCPPRNFLPALCRIILDETAPDNILEVTARAITYYLDVSQDVLKRILSVEGSVKGICNRLASADMTSRTSKDLAEQCVKILELICQREADVIFQAGGLETMLNFVATHGSSVHKDTLYSAMSVITKLCSKIEPVDHSTLAATCASRLSQLLISEDQHVSDSVLRCFLCISDRCVRKNVDTNPLTKHGLIDYVFASLANYNKGANTHATTAHSQEPIVPTHGRPLSSQTSCSVIISLLASLCRGSQAVTDSLFARYSDQLKFALKNILTQREERLLLDALWFADLLLTILFDGRHSLIGKSSTPSSASGALLSSGLTPSARPFAITGSSLCRYTDSLSDLDRTQRYLTECIRYKDTDSLIDAIESGGIDINFTDDVGQTLLNWAAAFGTLEMVEYLCEKGADVNKGQKSSSLHYAACFGRPQIAKVLLRYGANPDLCDEEGKKPLDKARDRNDNGHKEVTAILENPAEWVPLKAGALAPTPETTADDGSAPSSNARPYLQLTPIYIKFFMPFLIDNYQKHNLISTLRRSTLLLVEKCLKCVDGKTLKEICEEHGLGQKLIEVLSSVLDSEDEDLQINALTMMTELLNKQGEVFSDSFERHGVLSKIQTLAEQKLEIESDLRQCVKDLATSLIDRHFGSSVGRQRPSVAKLQEIVEFLLAYMIPQSGDNENKVHLDDSLNELKRIITDEEALSTYELYSSGLIDALLTFAPYFTNHSLQTDEKFSKVYSTFKDIFCTASNSDGQNEASQTPLAALIRKLINCLENVEKLPQFIYDASTSTSQNVRPTFLTGHSGFQMFNKRFRFKLERSPEETSLVDKTSQTLRAESLVTVDQLKSHVSRLLLNQMIVWDNDHLKASSVFGQSANEASLGQAERTLPVVSYAAAAANDINNKIQAALVKDQQPGTANLIGQKSMSTTNLFDNKDIKISQHSTTTSNQAVSAESLQNPTASLENLIARSRLRDVQPPPLPEVSCESPTTPSATQHHPTNTRCRRLASTSASSSTANTLQHAFAVVMNLVAAASSDSDQDYCKGGSGSIEYGDTPACAAASALVSALSARRAQVLSELEEDEYADMPPDDDEGLGYECEDMAAFGSGTMDDDYAYDDHDYYPPPSQFADSSSEYEAAFLERHGGHQGRRRRNRNSSNNSGSQEGANKFTVNVCQQHKIHHRISNNMNNKRKGNWDDDFVLRRQFSALLPAFDPRPGRSNVNQMQDVELSALTETQSTSAFVDPNLPKLKLKIRLSCEKDGQKDEKIVALNDESKCIFYYVQKLVLEQQSTSSKAEPSYYVKLDKLKNIWEPTYTLIYEATTKKCNSDEQACDLIDFGSAVEEIEADIVEEVNEEQLIANNCCLAKLTKVLDLLKMLHKYANDFNSAELFTSKKMTEKLHQQLQDPLVVAGAALPDWCDRLMLDYWFLFPFETRQVYLKSTAFGTTRSICWLQSQRDQRLEQQRASSAVSTSGILRRTLEETHYFSDYRVGRIKHERVKVDRSDENSFFEWACRVMEFHAQRKSYLEVEFVGEEGTGLGPTLEFYALTAAELQRNSLGLWLCDDLQSTHKILQDGDQQRSVDLEIGSKPVGYYVRKIGGLFPAPYPQDCPKLDEVCKFFRFMGIFIAKVLQDGRLVDLPLSKPFLKFLRSNEALKISPSTSGAEILTLNDDNNGSLAMSLFDSYDFELVYPIKAKFLNQLNKLIEERRRILSAQNLTDEEKRGRLDGLRLSVNGVDVVQEGEQVSAYNVDDLGLTFQLNPPGQGYGYDHVDLIPNGGSINVECSNVETYVKLCFDFYMNAGLKRQLLAFKTGFDLVFPMERLRSFTFDEVQMLVSGQQYPEWTSDDIMSYTEPKLGFTKDSPGFLRFVDVLCEMTGEERKAFLQFTTGCSSLPPGGLMNLHPPLTIVRKIDATDGSYPSVNTCVHYLKLPEYSSKALLKERLLAATKEKGFHLN